MLHSFLITLLVSTCNPFLSCSMLVGTCNPLLSMIIGAYDISIIRYDIILPIKNNSLTPKL